jgi:CRP-like cAMP-binding protein
METLEKLLKEHPFFGGMKDEHLALLVGCAKNAVYKAGQFVFREGEDADSFFILRHGKIVVETFVPNKGPIAIQTREAGEVLGWSWLVLPYRWRFDARAVELTRAVVLDGKCLRDRLDEDHDLGYELMKRFSVLIAQRLEATRLQLMDLYGNPADS